MVCRVALFQYKENSRDVAEACADQMVKVFSEYEGFVNVTFIGSYDKDIYGTAVLWESEAAADNAAESIRARHNALVGDQIVGIVEQKQFDVYVPIA